MFTLLASLVIVISLTPINLTISSAQRAPSPWRRKWVFFLFWGDFGFTSNIAAEHNGTKLKQLPL